MGGEDWRVHNVPVSIVSEVNSSDYDALVLVITEGVAPPQAVEDFIAAARQVDATLDKVQASL